MDKVYAYRDDGPMMEVSRWKPRKIVCTSNLDHSDKPGNEHVVKLSQGPVGAAAQISEVVCTGLLAARGVATLEMKGVHVGFGFAASYDDVAPGVYFGSVLLLDVINGPPPSKVHCADPQELVDIWAFDSWYCNIDPAFPR